MEIGMNTLSWAWPDVVNNPPKTPEEYRPEITDEHRRKGAAIADQLSAWAGCMAGNKPPEGFGWAMATLSQISGAATPEQCSAAADQWHKDNDELDAK